MWCRQKCTLSLEWPPDATSPFPDPSARSIILRMTLYGFIYNSYSGAGSCVPERRIRLFEAMFMMPSATGLWLANHISHAFFEIAKNTLVMIIIIIVIKTVFVFYFFFHFAIFFVPRVTDITFRHDDPQSYRDLCRLHFSPSICECIILYYTYTVLSVNDLRVAPSLKIWLLLSNYYYYYYFFYFHASSSLMKLTHIKQSFQTRFELDKRFNVIRGREN